MFMHHGRAVFVHQPLRLGFLLESFVEQLVPTYMDSTTWKAVSSYQHLADLLQITCIAYLGGFALNYYRTRQW